MATIQQALHAVPKPRFMLVSDLDHTMVQNEDLTHEKLQMFNRLWSINFSSDSLLVFSTGRSPNLFCQLWDEAPLLTPNVLICSVGTEIFYRTADGSLLPDQAWEAHLDQGWDRAAVQALAAQIPQLTPQVASEQRRHKLSYHLQRCNNPADDEGVLQGLRDSLAAAGLAAKVIYSGGVDVDVLAQGAGKGKALEFILKELKDAGAYPPDGVQVNGDSGNDIELFQVPGVRGCVVSNAHPELRTWATAALDPANPSHTATPATLHIAQQPCAGGIVEALLLFGSVQNPPQSQSLLRGFVTELGLLQSNALAGNLALLAEPGATWVTPAGKVLQVVQCMGEPADAAAAGLTWVDRICVRPLLQSQQGAAAAADAPAGSATNSSSAAGASSISEGELLVVTYQLWSFKGQSRDSSRVRQCSAVVRAVQPGAADGFKLLHLHEGVMAADVTATAAFAALAATSP